MTPPTAAPIPTIDHRILPVNDALRFWRTWTADVSPCGSTGFSQIDRQHADAFRALLALPDREARLAWLERAVFTTNDFVPAATIPDHPGPMRPCSPYREELIRWWLEIYDETGR